MANLAKRPDGKWRARYRDEQGRQHAKHFRLKKEAEDWLADVAVSVKSGTYVDPARAKLTVAQWCTEWIEAYSGRPSTIRQARTHLARIEKGLGKHRLSALRPSHVKAWIKQLQDEPLEPSYVYALHARLAQLMTDAVHDGLVPRSPCSRRTAPPAGRQRTFIATTEQMWALHDAMPERYRAAVLLGAFAGLRDAEVCGIRKDDVAWLEYVIRPAVQYPEDPLKTEESKTPIPVARELVDQLAAHLAAHPSDTWILTDDLGQQVGPWKLQRAVRTARKRANLPAEFRFHDLRHYYASLLISDGADVKVVQARLRHSSAKTTLDTYAHLWPDTDEATRTATAGVLRARIAASAEEAVGE
ncbi:MULTISPECIES: site-specific integrase [unclassified Isoptericola]|uniref:site-specific integrase n=1 Tax=unclassified Isoptericola TaxID=2623355 RepID=UPI0036643DE7